MSTPVNITRLLRQNDQFADANAYARSITQGSIVSAWHERSLKQPPGAATGVKDCIAHQAGHAQHAAEAGAAAQRGAEREAEGAAEAALLCARRARLAQLLERERLGFEAELEARGMALDLVHFRQ